jgi:hypothetical protein
MKGVVPPMVILSRLKLCPVHPRRYRRCTGHRHDDRDGKVTAIWRRYVDCADEDVIFEVCVVMEISPLRRQCGRLASISATE